MTKEKQLTVPEVAKRIGRSVPSVYRYIRQRRIAATSFLNTWRIKEADIKAFIDRETKVVTPEAPRKTPSNGRR